MVDIAELRDLQREYIEKRNYWNQRIRQQQSDLLNCAPSASLLAACRVQAREYADNAASYQKRIDAIQVQLDEAIGISA